MSGAAPIAGAPAAGGDAPQATPGGLRVEGLSKEFGGIHAVQDLSFAIGEGKVHSIIGPNGAGKTTLLNLLTGVYVPSAGRIALAGCDLTGRPAHEFAAAGIGRTFQNLQIFFNMSALENVMTGRHLRERSGLLATLLRTPRLARAERDCRARALELLEFVGLGAHGRSAADAMPYGALKRLEIARALAGDPRILLLDEPAAGLNPTESQEIAALIRRLAQAGTTVVLVEHNMRLVMGVSDHILVLDYGRKLAEGSAEAVRNDPRVIEAYLGAAAGAEHADA
ncbi:MAG: ABC transporter ATP-binding protein [Burkholderiaceae bacterium]|nr:ABC transporter ATP-binding protein [Burkholderiaceae bacterium]